MHQRLCTHARLWGDLLPLSLAPLGQSPTNRNRTSLYVGATFSALDYWEPEFSCNDEDRVPPTVGDGPKWVCGVEALHQPCTLLSLGSNLDDSFERAMHARARCRAYIVDPTIDLFRNSSPAFEHRETAEQFAARLAPYGATLNASVGVGNPGSTGTAARKSFRLVSLGQLLRDRYGPPPWRLSGIKMDIEGHEATVLPELFRLCSAGKLQVEQLNVELHPWPDWYGGRTFRDVRQLFASFTDALSCGLVLHHKERNLWGCPKSQCMEFSWVSLRHARRAAEAAIAPPAESAADACWSLQKTELVQGDFLYARQGPCTHKLPPPVALPPELPTDMRQCCAHLFHGKHGYQLGDLVTKRPRGLPGGEWAKMADPRMWHLRDFPDSVAADFIRATDNSTTPDEAFAALRKVLAERLRQREGGVDAGNGKLVVHLRVGDVIEESAHSLDQMLARNTRLWPDRPGSNYVKPLQYFDTLPVSKLPSKSAVIMAGSHLPYSSFNRSCLYIDAVRRRLQGHGLDVALRCGRDVDDDLVYASSAAVFVPAGGGFSHLIARLVASAGGVVVAHGHG